MYNYTLTQLYILNLPPLSVYSFIKIMNYNHFTTSIGWALFAITMLTYGLTLEPTASLWDCSEFIACAYKLQIAHPPGAPLFIMITRLFASFAGSNVDRVAYFVNLCSAVSSALTITFLFWTIVLLVHKLTTNNMLVLTAGIIGSLSFAFTDSFWFSAVEAEVYAMSSLFTAITFWAVLKWEKNVNDPSSSRWLVLIAYLMGLSIGIHLLNILAIPAIVMVIYFKDKPYTRKRFLLSFIISALIIGFILKILIPGVPYIGSRIDLFFVNKLSMKFNQGFLIFITLFMFFLGWLSVKKYTNKNKPWSIVYPFLFVFMLGYSTYASVVIRSAANPPVDMNNPDNPFSLITYLNREQYMKRPILYGHYYNAPAVERNERHTFVPFNDKYIKETLNPKITYDKKFCTFFPRMASTQPGHVEYYKKWGNSRNHSVSNKNSNTANYVPTFGENLRFFFRYQLGHMYFRYFMWNFVGRQNDIQGFGSHLNGNWISGIPLIDNALTGTNEKNISDNEALKARNTYYFLPLLLGIMGIVCQYKRKRKDLLMLATLFAMTGIAIVIYLNEIPITPRERDYVYVGSFYVFAMWIGIGTLEVYRLFNQWIPGKISLLFTFFISFAAVPLLLFTENIDDHDRSNRFLARDLAINYLESCAKNAILFTTADNDTYPIWYAQEVEKIRTDVSNVLLPYLSANWYIDQKRIELPDSQPIHLSLGPDFFVNGKSEYLPVVERIKKPVELQQLIEFVKSDHPKTKVKTRNGNNMNYLPSKSFFVNISVENGNDCVIKGTIEGNYILKPDLVVLDVIAQNINHRPIYFLNPVQAKKLGLSLYLKREGLAFRLSPFDSGDYLRNRNYQLLMNTFSWGNLNHDNVYVDWTGRRTVGMVLNIRNDFLCLARQLFSVGDKHKAIKVLNNCMKILPHHKIPPDIHSVSMAELYHRLGEHAMGSKLTNNLSQHFKTTLEYLHSFTTKDERIKFEIKRYMFCLDKVNQLIQKYEP